MPERTRAKAQAADPGLGSPQEPTARELIETLMDVLVYAPIGLILDVETVGPELVKRGRQNAAAARQIGEFAVKRGMKRIDEVLNQPSSARNGTTPRKQRVEHPAPPMAEAAIEDPAPPPSADHLAIPEYDLLAASQVVKRLDALSADELEAVRVYESTSRDRRTILHKIARLQG